MAAFQKIYEEYAQPVYRFLLSLTGNEDCAEELLQETFYRALLHIDGFEGRCSLYTWLCQIGKNAWFRERRRRKRYCEEGWEELAIPSEDPTAEDQIIVDDEYRRVRKAIREMKNPYRDVFVMHALAGVKLNEIAIVYGKSESWARVTYFRAKQKIAQEVSK